MNLIVENQTFTNPLLVFAMEVEAGNHFEEQRKIFTGIGKVNAVYELMKAISEQKPNIVINLGTAGSTQFNKGEIVCCTEFIQRDMEVTALGFQKFETPFSNESVVLNYGLNLENLPKGICGSGDNFEMEHQNPEYNVIDMEAFALAKICQRENIPFLCLKYISDGANDNAVSDWNEEVKKVSKRLRDIINSHEWTNI